MLKKIISKIDEILCIKSLLKVVLVLLILFLLQETDRVWGTWFNVALTIIKPFVYGFAIAYVVHPLVEWMEQKKVKKSLSVFLIIISFIAMLVLLFMVLVPMLYDKTLDFFNSLAYAVQWITDFVTEVSESGNMMVVEQLSNTLLDAIRSYQSWLPQFVNQIPSIFMNLVSTVSTWTFSLLLSVYMLVDFERIKDGIRKFFAFFNSDSQRYLTAIDNNVGIYIHSLLLLMLIKFCEYACLYFLVGHGDWLIIALLTAIGLIIPYFGATIANCIGILTALTLSPIRFITLLIGIALLANLDGYVIGPLVHKKRSQLGPLVSIMVVFAGGIIAGVVGITIGIPLALAIKSIYEIYEEEHA